MGDIHAWPDACAWSPLVRLSALLKPNKQMSTDAKLMVENPRGTPSMQTDSKVGQNPCLARHLCMEPPCTAVRTIETLQQISIDPTNVVNNPRGTSSMQTDLFERWDRIPMCSFLWWTVMHGRTNVHGTPMCHCPPPPPPPFETQRTGGNSCYTHDKQRKRHAPTHPDACERRVRLPMCGYSWVTAMHERTPVHGTQ